MSGNSAGRTTPAASGPLIAPGARVGKYQIVHRIACGGMAEIYLARASGIHGFEKHVVLKRILPQYAANEEFVRMFLKEARVAASLDHANIAQVHDIGETAGNTFFTMEYLHGEDLRQIMRRLARGEQRLPLEHALEIVIGAASGLHFAHERRGPDGRSLGIVHRDISPANIVVTYHGGVKLVDFGIAKLAADPELSQRYALKGKLAYMSPEQLHHRPLDRRSDVFSLGVVLYEVTTHTRLFKGATEVETMKSVLDGIVPPPTTVMPGYPPALERIVLCALAPVPDERYQTARELQVALETFVHEERIRLSPLALAEWMECTFGPQQELWHRLPGTADAAPVAEAPVFEPTVVTKVTPHKAVKQPSDLGAPAESVAVRSAQKRSWGALLAAIALAAASGALWYARGGPGLDPANQSAPTLVTLVDDHDRVVPEPGALPPVPPRTAPPPAAAEAASLARIAAPAPAAAPRGRRLVESGAARGETFSATLGRRGGDIRRCFLDHPGAASSAEISLRFDVGRDGHVAAVAVQPAAVAGEPLGACLAAVGKSTVFQKQATPVTFRIPLTVQRTRKGGP